MKKVPIYARVSTADQSVEPQLLDLRQRRREVTRLCEVTAT